MHTGPIPTIVSAGITLNLVMEADYGLPVHAEFLYSVDQPLAVIARFRVGKDTVEWVFARELLSDGLTRPTGDGDITCWPVNISGRSVLAINLASDTGHALLEAPADEVEGFLRRTFDIIPHGAEADFIDFDALIADLLRGEGSE
jgi:hypothetical protein